MPKPIITPIKNIGETIYKRVCPLYSFDAADKPYLIGSAVPFETETGGFLITAAHVCFDQFNKPLPLFTWSEFGPLVLREFRIAWEYKAGYTPDADVALIALTEDDVIKLKHSYWFSNQDAVSATKPLTPGVHYLIAGYPFIRNRIITTRLAPPSMATHLITGQIASVQVAKFNDKSDDCHFTLSFPLGKIRTLEHNNFRIPKPQGMSGGGIWRLNIDTVTKMATTPQLVGIGIEYHATKEARIFVGTRIQLALSLTDDLFLFWKISK
jgi:hypothetical protein